MEFYPKDASKKEMEDLGWYYKIETKIKLLNRLFDDLNVPICTLGKIRYKFLEGWKMLEDITNTLPALKPHKYLFNVTDKHQSDIYSKQLKQIDNVKNLSIEIKTEQNTATSFNLNQDSAKSLIRWLKNEYGL